MDRSYSSPAKVNLCLKIKGRRGDGYHEIETLMQAVSLFDQLTFAPIPAGIEVSSDRNDVPAGESNIVWRAARLVLDEARIRQGIRIHIAKKIPIAAGLGGGSSNAATTLLALNEIFSLGFSRERLMQLGVQLGADVPFFIFGKTAWARGIGDVLHPAEGLPAFNYLIINPNFSLSTAAVYARVRIGLTKPPNDYSAPARFAGFPRVTELLVNDLEAVSFAMHPQIQKMKEFLLAEGACGALMSGSGPSVFGIFTEANGLSELAGRIKREKGWLAFTAMGLDSW